MGHRCGLDPSLLSLWCRLVAIAPIRHLAWELLDTVGVALKRPKKKNLVPSKAFLGSVCEEIVVLIKAGHLLFALGFLGGFPSVLPIIYLLGIVPTLCGNDCHY